MKHEREVLVDLTGWRIERQGCGAVKISNKWDSCTLVARQNGGGSLERTLFFLAMTVAEGQSEAGLEILARAMARTFPMIAIVRALDRECPGIRQAFAPPSLVLST